MKNMDSMWKSSVWSSCIASCVAAKFLAPDGILVLTGAQAALEGTPGPKLNTSACATLTGTESGTFRRTISMHAQYMKPPQISVIDNFRLKFPLYDRNLVFVDSSSPPALAMLLRQPFSCSTLPVPSCHATRRKHEGWDTARLPKPRQGKSSGGGALTLRPSRPMAQPYSKIAPIYTSFEIRR
ncbi:hypothetical protein T265_10887 [Opisthorchis viverrini]|uniref:Uncharacterized protein n=1 Tax=Opisthorchis viverrini TaxID=6198 RepID=A0A074ZZL8_OPIVI|nr:hypothetical protein T265_10887 [Opisthorchis viverrini]KER20609.1 hypothetical protein T265_10887 [Opisthorchis viverrini]